MIDEISRKAECYDPFDPTSRPPPFDEERWECLRDRVIDELHKGGGITLGNLANIAHVEEGQLKIWLRSPDGFAVYGRRVGEKSIAESIADSLENAFHAIDTEGINPQLRCPVRVRTSVVEVIAKSFKTARSLCEFVEVCAPPGVGKTEGRAEAIASFRKDEGFFCPVWSITLDETCVTIKAILTLIARAVCEGKGFDDKSEFAISQSIIEATKDIEGQFELRDMAKWLPQQMAYAKRAGLQGESGFATLVAGNQLSMTTAGTADDAGNNFKNLLAKVNSNDTAIDAKKMGIDLSGALAAAQAKGVGGLDAFLNLTEQVAAKDERLVKLRAQAKGAKGDDLRGNLQAQTDILEGSSIGKLVQDQQALGSLVAILNGREKFDSIRNKAMGANGTNDDLLQVVSDEPGAKAQLAAAEAANSMQEALNKVNPLLGTMADGLSGLAQNFPVLSAAVNGTGLVGYALGSTVLTARGLMSLFGGGAASTTAARAAAAATSTSSTWTASRLAAGGSTAALGLAPLGVMALATHLAGDPNDTFGSRNSDHKATTMFRGWSDSLTSTFGDMGIRFGPGNKPQEPVEQPVREPIHIVVDVKNGNIVAAVNEANARTASRH